MRGCSFGLERVHSNRYSTPNNMRGCKLSSQSMGKTMRMKLKKI